MRKKVIVILIFCIIFFDSSILAKMEELDINAKNIGVYTVNNLRSLYVKGEQERIPIASITKIMTAIVCIENVKDLNENVIVNLEEVQKYYDEEYSVAGLKDNCEVSYYDLIATMLIPSGADSAACIALNVFGDYDTFIQAMNDKAKQIGMNNTSFANPIGADDDRNYSTVNDVAIMMKYAMSNDILKDLMSRYSYTTKDGSITVHNALFILADIYGINVGKITGGKTGMTGDAGYCLASYSDKLEEPIICIVMGCEIKRGTLFHLTDSEKIYEYIEKNYDMKNIISTEEQIISLPVYGGVEENISINVPENVTMYIEKNEEIDKSKISLKYVGLESLTPKNKKGSIIGTASIYYDGIHIKDVNVVLDKKVTFSIVKWIRKNWLYIIVFIITLIAVWKVSNNKMHNIYKKKMKIMKIYEKYK